jgi:hypothetical protein
VITFFVGLCPASGVMSSSIGGTTEFDDLSGGSTVVSVPELGNLVPSVDSSEPADSFVAYTDLSAPGGAAPSSAGAGAVLGATRSVSLSIVPHAGGAAAFAGTLTPGSDGLGAFESLPVTGLATGRYFAQWLLTDVHGDTEAASTLFAAQPGGGAGATGASGGVGPAGPAGPGGAAGAAGATGKTGATGAAGTSELVKCTTKTSRATRTKKAKTTTTCKVSKLAPGAHVVSVRLFRGRTTFASGSAAVRTGAAAVALRRVRRVPAGRYALTVRAVDGRGVASVTRFAVTFGGR